MQHWQSICNACRNGVHNGGCCGCVSCQTGARTCRPVTPQPERELILESDSSRAEIASLLTMANSDTKREQRVVGPPGYPTRWDEAHEFLNELLDDWEHAPLVQATDDGQAAAPHA